MYLGFWNCSHSVGPKPHKPQAVHPKPQMLQNVQGFREHVGLQKGLELAEGDQMSGLRSLEFRGVGFKALGV